MWIWIIIIAVIIGGIWGYLSSDEDKKGADAFSGAVVGGIGCGYVLLQIFLWGLGIMFFLWLFGAIFS